MASAIPGWQWQEAEVAVMGIVMTPADTEGALLAQWEAPTLALGLAPLVAALALRQPVVKAAAGLVLAQAKRGRLPGEEKAVQQVVLVGVADTLVAEAPAAVVEGAGLVIAPQLLSLAFLPVTSMRATVMQLSITQ